MNFNGFLFLVICMFYYCCVISCVLASLVVSLTLFSLFGWLCSILVALNFLSYNFITLEVRLRNSAQSVNVS
jgi:hypothetical protein